MKIVYFKLSKDLEFVYFETDQIAILKTGDDSFMIVREWMKKEFKRIQDTVTIWENQGIKEEHERADEILRRIKQLLNGSVRDIQDQRAIKNFMLSLKEPAV